MASLPQMIANARNGLRDLITASNRGGRVSDKHKFECDYGWPDRLEFRDYYQLYSRYGLAAAAVDKTVSKTWQTFPEIWESEEATKSKTERDIAHHFVKAGIWKGLMEADRRGMVGHYGAAIILLRDGKPLSEPVDRVSRGIQSVAGIIPAWEGQLMPLEYDTNTASNTYGEPTLFNFDQTAVGFHINLPEANVRIHRDRLLIFSSDGTVNGRSSLQSGFNDVSDAAKIKGAGAEGFWKSSRGAPIIEAPEQISVEEIRKSMGATNNAEIMEALNDQVTAFQEGFDSAFLMSGFTVKPLQITLPQPKEFWEIAVQSFAASMDIPVKELIGNVTGERASTEDARSWNEANMSRRINRIIPVVDDFVDRLERWGVLDERDWFIGWESLLEAAPDAKMDRAFKMAEINAKGEPVFTADEMRIEAGHEALSDDADGLQKELEELRLRRQAQAEDTDGSPPEGANKP